MEINRWENSGIHPAEGFKIDGIVWKSIDGKTVEFTLLKALKQTESYGNSVSVWAGEVGEAGFKIDGIVWKYDFAGAAAFQGFSGFKIDGIVWK